jgi:hypothetical protein
MSHASPLVELIAELQADKQFALSYIFAHRHPDETPAFHKQIVAAWDDPHPRVLIEVFRGGGKSTLAEEYLTLAALFQEAQYILLVGNTYSSACDRLASIKHELENNEKIGAMFGSVRGATWTENDITLSNGVRVQAFGAGQSVRGAKEVTRNMRPDLVLIDDLEDRESVATPEARRKVWQWFTRELVPACDPKARIRVNGTPLHENSMIEELKRNANWKCLSFPIYTGVEPDRVPMWPARFPLSKINELYEQFRTDGDLAGFSQEYLLKPMDAVASIFDRNDIIYAAPSPAHLYIPRILIVDPARTTNRSTSARTGYVVGSWVGNELHVHEAIGGFHTPSEQIEYLFRLNDAHHPMTVAVEEDGLNQWLLQPIRAEMVRRADILPLQPVKAPRDKTNFIKGLQPFFRAHEVKFLKPLPDLEAELASFPLGRVDIVNALAYMLRLRPGMPVYAAFSSDHIQHRVPNARADWYVFVNATPGVLLAVLAFVQDGLLSVVKDWVIEGSIDDSLRAVLMSVSHEIPTGKVPQIVVPYDRTLINDASNLPATLKRLRLQYRTGKRIVDAQESLDSALRLRRNNAPTFTVSPEATWTLNALAGGYCREAGTASFAVRENVYKHVAQALESGYASLSGYALDSERADLVYSYTSTGRPYISMRR